MATKDFYRHLYIQNIDIYCECDLLGARLRTINRGLYGS